MQIIIHRGTHEIGGTCIQLSTANTTILLDLGLPLSKDSKKIDLSAIKVDAVVISHPHADHYGLIDIIDSKTPVYIGELGKNLIDATSILLGKELHKNNFQYFKSWKTFRIGDFKVTPYLVDHSACDAYAFLLEAEGKRIFYSGDFRSHGRKGVLFEKIIKNPPENIDLLFMEGSMIGHNNSEFPTETSVEKKIYEVINDQQNISFLLCSSQNIDRIVSAYRACLRAEKTLIIDFYTAWVLEQIKIVTQNVPAMDWNNVRVFAEYRQDKIIKENPRYFGDFRENVYKRYRVRKEELYKHPEQYLCISKMSKFKVIDSFKKEKPVNVIYSQWIGYLENPEHKCYGAEQVAAYRSDPKISFTYAHTSGHAPVRDLQRFAKAIHTKILVPVHTEDRLSFHKYFDNIKPVNDNEIFYL